MEAVQQKNAARVQTLADIASELMKIPDDIHELMRNGENLRGGGKHKHNNCELTAQHSKARCPEEEENDGWIRLGKWQAGRWSERHTIVNSLEKNKMTSENQLLQNNYYTLLELADSHYATAALDTGATASASHPMAPTIDTGRESSKLFQSALGRIQPATKEVKFDIPLRGTATTAHELPGVTNNLVSVGKIADEDYTTIFTKEGVDIYDNRTTKITISKEAVLKGYRCRDTGLWRIPLRETVTNENTQTLLVQCPKTTEAIHNVYELPSTEQTIKYLHAAAGFPTKKTWIEAINRNAYASWPGLTATAVRKYFPESDETMKGHSKGQRQGIRSTQTASAVEAEQENTSASTEPETTEALLYVGVYSMQEMREQAMFTDQTGKLPVMSVRGNEYIMVCYESKSNAILMEPMKSRKEGDMIKAYRAIMTRIKAAGIHPKLQILDNEASAKYKEEIVRQVGAYELVPSNQHRRNIAERAIQTAKAHIISGFSGLPANFPMQLWCYMIPQMELTLNMLRRSNITPNVSASEHLYGPHNYNRQPLAPLGCEVQVYEPPLQRKSWAPRTVKGWYVGTSKEHYRAYKVWVEKTKSTRISETVFFKHKYLTNPTVSPQDWVVKAANNLSRALANKGPVQSTDMTELKRLVEIFEQQAANIAAAESSQGNQDGVASPRVPTTAAAAAPRVQTTQVQTALPRVSDPAAALPVTFTNYVTQEEEEEPSSETRATLLMLQAMEVSTIQPQAGTLAARKYPLQLLCEMANAVLDTDTGELMEYRHLMKKPKYKTTWGNAFGNEVGRLAQGMPGRVKGTDTIVFIPQSNIPQDRWKDVTYARICCNYRPEKADPNRVRITIGGDRINYPGDCGTPTADLTTVKLLFNSIISTPGAKFMSIDIKDFYLNTPLPRKEYIRMKLDTFPEDVIAQYNLKQLAHNGHVYAECNRGIYGLPHAGILAQRLLEERLEQHGYKQSKITPGFWRHETRPIAFTLVVDDFGVRYVGKEHADHLLSVIQQHYKCTADWSGNRYLGMTLEWDYDKREVHLSMPGYVKEALVRFNHPPPKKPQHQPHPHTPIVYGAKQQLAKGPDTAPPLDKTGQKFIQEVTGVFNYYARAVDATMLPALSAIASEQANPTETTLAKTKQFLDYAATHPNAVLTYRSSGMHLAIHSDASYLSERQARSRAGGHYFLSEQVEDPKLNGAILNISQIIKNVMSSSAEAETGALYLNATNAIPIRQILNEMGHKQGRTPIQTDNSTAGGYVNKTIQPKQSKQWDMRHHWLRDRECQGQFNIYWRPGKSNHGDYWTKHHPAKHHQIMRQKYLNVKKEIEILQMMKEVLQATTTN